VPKLLLIVCNALLLQKFDKWLYEIIVVSDGPDEQTKQYLMNWADMNIRNCGTCITGKKRACGGT
jgi:glycosyltransferase involved in cell wall biosynthesis